MKKLLIFLAKKLGEMIVDACMKGVKNVVTQNAKGLKSYLGKWFDGWGSDAQPA